jgi:hypothetical protein
MRALPLLILLPLLTIALYNYVAEPLVNRLLPHDDGPWEPIRDLLLFGGGFPLAWLAITPLIIFWYRRIPFTREHLLRFTLAHAAICLTFSLVKGSAHVLIFHSGMSPGRANVPALLTSSIVHHFTYDVVFYAGVISLYQALDYFKKLRQKELDEARLAESLATAQLQSLKMKLQPHFLFNALQSISVLVLEKNVTAATEMLERLGNLLRISMESDENLLVPLEKELTVLDYYLGIEEIRFMDRLNVHRVVDESAKGAFVPNLILQPLVENSIKHGVSNRIDAGTIDLEIRRAGKQLLIRVANDGPALPDAWEESLPRGIGLRTTIRRLELLFPDDFEFSMRNLSQGGVATEVAIPFIERASEEAGGDPA